MTSRSSLAPFLRTAAPSRSQRLSPAQRSGTRQATAVITNGPRFGPYPASSMPMSHAMTSALLAVAVSHTDELLWHPFDHTDFRSCRNHSLKAEAGSRQQLAVFRLRPLHAAGDHQHGQVEQLAAERR